MTDIFLSFQVSFVAREAASRFEALALLREVRQGLERGQDRPRRRLCRHRVRLPHSGGLRERHLEGCLSHGELAGWPRLSRDNGCPIYESSDASTTLAVPHSSKNTYPCVWS